MTNGVFTKGFPTFPVVGNMHRDIFDGLIPRWHLKNNVFVNQDLDPYLQRLYLKFGAAPLLKNVWIRNEQGGSDLKDARYERISAKNWKQLVSSDTSYIERYLRMHHNDVRSKMKVILDVIVPSYRVDVENLQRICNLNVPEIMKTTFIIIIDNPKRLKSIVTELGLDTTDSSKEVHNVKASYLLETFLSSKTINNIRVRCNEVNVGASTSRNRGIQESSAEYLLFLDDDIIPDQDLLTEYGKALVNESEEKPILGLVGMVRFPRSNDMKIIHSAVHMSYLTFMFEIAGNKLYKEPAWGVTASILFKNFPGISFDTRYAKTGGGEDVDISLRLGKEHRCSLKSCPKAIVHHPFWKGGFFTLCEHFFCWAIGDGALFDRFPNHTYYSFPNYVESFFLLLVSSVLTMTFHNMLRAAGVMFAADVLVDMCWKWGEEFNHRHSLLEYKYSLPYTIAAHIVANFYIIILETGRLYGHFKRGQVWNVMRRFDWHCGRLSKSSEHFVQREFIKFVCFSIIMKVFSSYR